MAIRDIEVEELYQVAGRVLVDVRSPGEFAESTIPGSVNVPLFSDAERAEIGTVYKQQSPAAARRLAMMTVSPKIPQIVEQMEALLQQGELVLFCWRGGMRSYAAATFLDLLKIPVRRLHGGYRAYRQMVVHKLADYPGLQSPVIVLHGLTGVGKTRVLMGLQERGEQVLDLEGMANHRGSVFGWIGLGAPNNQKTFDALLWENIRQFDPSRPVFMEAESKRIGRAVMPEWLDENKKHGIHVLVEASLDHRVERLMEDYLPFDPDSRVEEDEIHRELTEALLSIKRRLSGDDFENMEELLRQRDYGAFCGELLVKYYDPKYLHTLKQYANEFVKVNADDIDKAVDRLEELAHDLSQNRLEKRGVHR